MHAEQFDQLSKALATGGSRRTVLKILAGGLTGTLLAVAGGQEAQAQRGRAHSRCQRVHQRCQADAQCCGNATCDAASGRCVCLVQAFCVPGYRWDRSTCQCVRRGRGGDATGQFCGGIAAITCPDGYVCVDDPNDTCDPNEGGADCGGTCVAA